MDLSSLKTLLLKQEVATDIDSVIDQNSTADKEGNALINIDSSAGPQNIDCSGKVNASIPKAGKTGSAHISLQKCRDTALEQYMAVDKSCMINDKGDSLSEYIERSSIDAMAIVLNDLCCGDISSKPEENLLQKVQMEMTQTEYEDNCNLKLNSDCIDLEIEHNSLNCKSLQDPTIISNLEIDDHDIDFSDISIWKTSNEINMPDSDAVIADFEAIINEFAEPTSTTSDNFGSPKANCNNEVLFIIPSESNKYVPIAEEPTMDLVSSDDEINDCFLDEINLTKNSVILNGLSNFKISSEFNANEFEAKIIQNIESNSVDELENEEKFILHNHNEHSANEYCDFDKQRRGSLLEENLKRALEQFMTEGFGSLETSLSSDAKLENITANYHDCPLNHSTSCCNYECCCIENLNFSANSSKNSEPTPNSVTSNIYKNQLMSYEENLENHSIELLKSLQARETCQLDELCGVSTPSEERPNSELNLEKLLIETQDLASKFDDKPILENCSESSLNSKFYLEEPIILIDNSICDNKVVPATALNIAVGEYLPTIESVPELATHSPASKFNFDSDPEIIHTFQCIQIENAQESNKSKEFVNEVCTQNVEQKVESENINCVSLIQNDEMGFKSVDNDTTHVDACSSIYQCNDQHNKVDIAESFALKGKKNVPFHIKTSNESKNFASTSAMDEKVLMLNSLCESASDINLNPMLTDLGNSETFFQYDANNCIYHISSKYDETSSEYSVDSSTTKSDSKFYTNVTTSNNSSLSNFPIIIGDKVVNLKLSTRKANESETPTFQISSIENLAIKTDSSENHLAPPKEERISKYMKLKQRMAPFKNFKLSPEKQSMKTVDNSFHHYLDNKSFTQSKLSQSKSKSLPAPALSMAHSSKSKTLTNHMKFAKSNRLPSHQSSEEFTFVSGKDYEKLNVCNSKYFQNKVHKTPDASIETCKNFSEFDLSVAYPTSGLHSGLSKSEVEEFFGVSSNSSPLKDGKQCTTASDIKYALQKCEIHSNELIAGAQVTCSSQEVSQARQKLTKAKSLLSNWSSKTGNINDTIDSSSSVESNELNSLPSINKQIKSKTGRKNIRSLSFSFFDVRMFVKRRNDTQTRNDSGNLCDPESLDCTADDCFDGKKDNLVNIVSGSRKKKRFSWIW